MKKIIAIAVLVLVITASAFAGYIGVEVNGDFYMGNVKIRNEEGEYESRYHEEYATLSLTAIGEFLTYMEDLGFGGGVTFEKPLYWERYGKDLDVSQNTFRIREVCGYVIFPSGIYYTSTFNIDAGLYYRREYLASQVGGNRCHTIGLFGKFEFVFDNPSFVVPRIGCKIKMPFLSFVEGDTRAIMDGVSIGAYVTLGFGG